MQSGKLRQRVNLQQATETRDAHGGVIFTWATVSTVWASIEPMRGKEVFEAGQTQERQVSKMVLRYASLDPKWRIVHGSTTYEVLSVVNVDTRDRTTEVLVVEVTD